MVADAIKTKRNPTRFTFLHCSACDFGLLCHQVWLMYSYLVPHLFPAFGALEVGASDFPNLIYEQRAIVKFLQTLHKLAWNRFVRAYHCNRHNRLGNSILPKQLYKKRAFVPALFSHIGSYSPDNIESSHSLASG